MQPQFNPARPFSKIYGPSPADVFQDGHHFDGTRNYLTWAQASGEAEKPVTAAETEIQSMEAVERAKNSVKAQSPVPTDAPQHDSTLTVGQPSVEDAVAAAEAALNEARKAAGQKPIEAVTADSEAAVKDDAVYQAHTQRYEKALAMNARKLQGICTKIVDDAKDSGHSIDGSFPKMGRGSQKANAKFVASHTG